MAVSTEPREPGWLLRRALAAAADEERARHHALRAAQLANDDKQREWLQQALESVLGVTMDVSEPPTDPEGRPHIYLGGEEFRAIPPTGETGPLPILIVRCPGCWRVEREIVIGSWARLGEALSDGSADPLRCSRCDTQWGARDAA